MDNKAGMRKVHFDIFRRRCGEAFIIENKKGKPMQACLSLLLVSFIISNQNGQGS
jgi:hypothetical protein